MTVQEKMKQVFGIAFNGNNQVFSERKSLGGLIDCSGVTCSNCPLDKNCKYCGVGEWLNSEYKEEEAMTSALKTEYEKGVEVGRQQVYIELSKIFKR